jgi:hypothetical protein
MDGLVNLSEIQFLSSDYQPNPQTNSGTFWIIFGSIAGVMVLVATAISISVVWSVKKQKHITKTK